MDYSYSRLSLDRGYGSLFNTVGAPLACQQVQPPLGLSFELEQALQAEGFMSQRQSHGLCIWMSVVNDLRKVDQSNLLILFRQYPRVN